MPSQRKLPASLGSSPDPLSQSTGPTVSTTPRAKRSPQKRRTTVFSTPTKVTTSTTSSPWRFRVVVEAERDDDPGAADDDDGDASVMLSRGRKTRTRTTTTKIPLKGLSPEPAPKGVTGKRKATPAKSRSRSPKRTSAPKRTPAPKKAPRARGRTPAVVVVEEEQQERDAPLVEEMEVDEEPEVSERSTRKRRSPAKPRAPPARTTRRSTVGGSSPSRAAVDEGESVSNSRSVLSRRDPNTLLSPTPPTTTGSKRPTRRSARSTLSTSSPSPPPAPPVVVERGGTDDEEEASIEQSEGFSLISTHDLIPGLRDSLQSHTTLSTHQEEGDEGEGEGGDGDIDMELPDFTYISTGTSYTPRVSKKRALSPESPEGELFEDDPVGVESFYGVPIPMGLFRSSPPPEFSRDMITPVVTGEKTPQLPPRIPDGSGSRKKRMRETPGLDGVLRAGEELRSSMGADSSPGMEMRSERFGGALDNDNIVTAEGSPSARPRKEDSIPEAVSYSNLRSGVASPSASEESIQPADRKGKGKLKAMPRRRRAAAREYAEAKASEVDWAPNTGGSNISPSKPAGLHPGERTRMLEDIWAQEREDVRRQAMEAGAITINESPSRTMLLEQKWQDEREEVKRKAEEVGSITIESTCWEAAGADESAMTMAGQDTKAFEASIYNRFKMDGEAVPEKLFPGSPLKKASAPSSSEGSAPTSFSSGGRMASSTLGIRGESISSHSSPPPTAPTTMYQPSTREQAMAQTTTAAGTRPTTAAGPNVTNMLPPDLLPPSAPTTATADDKSGWTVAHWKLLETTLYSRKTQPPESAARRLLVSIDDPAKLNEEGLLDDDDLDIVKSRGELWLRLSVRETYAIERFLRKRSVESEGWEEKTVAGKMAAMVLASARRRRRAGRRVGAKKV